FLHRERSGALARLRVAAGRRRAGGARGLLPGPAHRADRLPRAGRRPRRAALPDAAGAGRALSLVKRCRTPASASTRAPDRNLVRQHFSFPLWERQRFSNLVGFPPLTVPRLETAMGAISDFLDHHYRHFNSAALVDAARGYVRHVDSGGQMLITLAGAMSTAELGLSLAEMIRRGKVHAITCTGANLEEDIFNLGAHDHYVRVPDWRNLTAEQEKELERAGRNRVTDTCIPEGEAFRAIENEILELWQRADRKGERYFPHEFFYQMIREGMIEKSYQIDPKDSWLVAAC